MAGAEKSKHTRCLIIAGEPSGDLRGAELIAAMQERANGTVEFFGIGGSRMENAGAEILFPVEKMAILGFVEVLRHLPFIRTVFNTLLSKIERRRPDAVILIDYPGFNIRFARRVRKKYGDSIRILYYISPQVWAWKKRRIFTIVRNIDAMAVVFPFEEEMYRELGVNTRFVGHPLIDAVAPVQSRDDFFSSIGLHPAERTIGLLPGSRKQEIERHLPVMLEAVRLLSIRFRGLQCIIAKTPYLSRQLYTDLIESHEFAGAAAADAPVLSEETYDVMSYSDFLVVSSGTATLESGLAGTPMAVMYRMAPLTYLIAKQVVKLRNIALINIVHETKVVPELIQDQATPENVAGVAAQYFDDSDVYTSTQSALKTTALKLGSPGAAGRAADFFLDVIAGIDSSEK